MANATTTLFVAGLLVVLPVSAGNPKRGQAAQQAAPDVLVLVEGGNLVAPAVLLQAETTATRMFARIGLRVQWPARPPAPDPAETRCTPAQPEVIVIRIASKKSASAVGEALASALPYAHTGTRITIFYGDLQEAVSQRPGLAPALLAHVLVHEITHVLQRVTGHSSEGVMRAHWTTSDYISMRDKPLEFTAADVTLIRKGQAQPRAKGCMSALDMTGSSSGQAVPAPVR